MGWEEAARLGFHWNIRGGGIACYCWLLQNESEISDASDWRFWMRGEKRRGMTSHLSSLDSEGGIVTMDRATQPSGHLCLKYCCKPGCRG